MIREREQSRESASSPRKNETRRRPSRLLRIAAPALIAATLATGGALKSTKELSPATFFAYPLVTQADIKACEDAGLLNVRVVSIQEAGGHNFIGPETEACPVWVAQFRATGSPAAPYAVEMYAITIRDGVNAGAVNGWLRRESNLGNDGGIGEQKQDICNVMDKGVVRDYSHKGGWVAGFEDCIAIVEYWSNHAPTPPAAANQPDNEIDRVLYKISPPEDGNLTAQMIYEIKDTMDKVNRESFPEGFNRSKITFIDRVTKKPVAVWIY